MIITVPKANKIKVAVLYLLVLLELKRRNLPFKKSVFHIGKYDVIIPIQDMFIGLKNGEIHWLRFDDKKLILFYYIEQEKHQTVTQFIESMGFLTLLYCKK